MSIIIELELPSHTHLAEFPTGALLDSETVATFLGMTKDALIQSRYRGRGLTPLKLSRRRVRYHAADVATELARREACHASL